MLRINAFGCLSVISDAGELTGAATQPRRLAILAMLARAGERGLSRDKILALLWTDTEEVHARKVLAKALSALRRDLGADDVFIGGANDLRLNAGVVSSDVHEFELALAEGDLERAAAGYAGPFLDAFRLPGAPEFERWVEVERDALARDYELTLEKLAAAASARGAHGDAVRWLRKLAAQDPLNARHALRLMRALADAGDRLGAVHHARVYEALVEQELDLPPDREVVALAERLRREHTAVSGAEVSPATAPPPSAATASGPVSSLGESMSTAAGPLSAVHASGAADASGADSPALALPAMDLANAEATDTETPRVARIALPWSVRPRVAATFALGTLALVALAVGVVVSWSRVAALLRLRAKTPGPAVTAVGLITDYRPGHGSELARPLADMLATNLARARGLRVVSTARLYEVMRQLGTIGDTTGAGHVEAARRAGATRMLDGSLFEVAGGRLRLDLRLVELATGSVVQAYSVTGDDPFTLADSGTTRLVSAAGAAAPSGSLAEKTTRSFAAYRLYEEGLRRLAAADSSAAQRLFEAALAEDSTFAMAAFYVARSARIPADRPAHMRRAQRLAEHTSDRERLIIQAEWAQQRDAPNLLAIAETLAVRYPDEVEGHYYAGVAAVEQGRFADAIPHLNRVVQLDSLGLRGTTAGCSACAALQWIVAAYQLMDSLPQAEREATRWIQLQPRAASAWQAMSNVLLQRGRFSEALAALRRGDSLAQQPDAGLTHIAGYHISTGEYEEAERLLRQLTNASDPNVAREARWFMAISLRQRGRLEDALAEARQVRRLSPRNEAFRRAVPPTAAMEAQVLFELGRYAAASALFDSAAQIAADSELASPRARNRGWSLTHLAASRAAMGDTLALHWLADTIQSLGALTGRARDQRLHHHVRGLLWLARGRLTDAVSEFRQAIYSTAFGYTRTNYELAQVYLRLGQPRDAVAILQPALRGSIEASNLYVTRTELHELLARAWAVAGVSDSAAVHARAVVNAWANADPSFAPRREQARQYLAKRE